MAVLGARLRPGVELVLELTGLRRRRSTAPTWSSPARARSTSRRCTARRRPGSPRRRGRAGVPVVAVAGRCLLDAADAGAARDSTPCTRLLDEARKPDEAFSDPGPLLRRIGARIAADGRTGDLSMSLDRRCSGRRRAVVDGAERACVVGVRDGRIVAVEAPAPTSTPTRIVELGDRRGAAARPGRHPRARQRARPDRVGGLRHRDPGGRGRRGHHHRRHAAEQHPADDHHRRAARQAASAPATQAHVDVGFWGGAVPGNLADLAPLHDAGRVRLQVLSARLRGRRSSRRSTPASSRRRWPRPPGSAALLIVHAEDAAVIDAAPPAHGEHYAAFLRSRPPEAENRAVRVGLEAARRARRPGARAAPVQRRGAARVRAARAAGADVSVETCPHYLALDAETVPDGATQFKCCPPIREPAQPGSALGRHWPRATSTWSSPTTRRAPWS